MSREKSARRNSRHLHGHGDGEGDCSHDHGGNQGKKPKGKAVKGRRKPNAYETVPHPKPKKPETIS